MNDSKWIRCKTGLVSLACMLPALVLTGSGILYLSFGWEGTNRFLELCLSSGAGKLLLSPVVVFGGPVIALIINLWEVCHLSAETIHDELVIALSIKRLS